MVAATGADWRGLVMMSPEMFNDVLAELPRSDD